MAGVCEHEEFFVGKFVMMCRRRGGGAVYLQLCTNLAMCAHTKALRTGTPCSNHIQHLVLQRGNTLTDIPWV